MHNLWMLEYTPISISAAKHLGPKLLLITATPTETDALHRKMAPLNGRSLFQTTNGPHTYFIGQFGKFLAVHAECNMGGITSGGSTLTSHDAIALYDPAYVLMIGVAFGANSTKQAIGDVIVADQVIPYDIKRVGKDQTQYRSPRPPCSATLKDRFKHSSVTCFQGTPNERLIGAILSGESLEDNEAERDKLLAEFSHAIGGEMEGAGLFAAAHSSNKEWIIVKGICDFGDGNKSVNKQQNQELAAGNAVSLCESVFSDPTNFPLLTPLTGLHMNPNNVLFEFYDPTFEPYYLIRHQDKHIEAVLQNDHVWLHGTTGAGKTVIIRRLLSLSATPFTIIDLSPYVGQDVPYLLREIAFRLGAAVGVNTTTPEITKQITDRLLQTNYRYILIDELPIDSEEDFRTFRDSICAILIGLRNQSIFSPVRLILVSLQDPAKLSKPFHAQIYEKLNVIEIKAWSDSEIQTLLEHVKLYLPYLPSPHEQAILVRRAGDCPRTLKGKLRGYYTYRALDSSFILKDENYYEL